MGFSSYAIFGLSGEYFRILTLNINAECARNNYGSGYLMFAARACTREIWSDEMPEAIDSGKRIVVFAPHPDDAILGCGGTIAKRTEEGFEVLIVMMTDGRHAFSLLGIDSEPSPEEVKRIRREEFFRASRMLGVPEKNLFFFDFEDGTLEKHWKEAVDRTVGILKRYWPADVYYPFRRDCHLDHTATNHIIREALHQLRFEGSYEYTIIHKAARFGPAVEMLISFFKRNRVEVNISEFLNLKKKAISQFESEITIISSKQKEPLHESVSKFLKSKEVFYKDR